MSQHLILEGTNTCTAGRLESGGGVETTSENESQRKGGIATRPFLKEPETRVQSQNRRFKETRPP